MGYDKNQSIQRLAATHMLHAVFQMKSEIEGRVQAQTDLLLADNEALLNLAQDEGGLRMTDISKRLILSKGGTTKVVDRLEKKGLVRRFQNPSDRRALIVEITPEGRKTLAAIRPIVDQVIEEYWGKHLSDDEASTVVDIADRIIHANEECFD